jgi:hypothetical protein
MSIIFTLLTNPGPGNENKMLKKALRNGKETPTKTEGWTPPGKATRQLEATMDGEVGLAPVDATLIHQA